MDREPMDAMKGGEVPGEEGRPDAVWEPLAEVLAAAEVGLWMQDLESGRMWFGRRCQVLFGVPPSESCAWVMDHVHPDDRERARARVEAALDPSGPGRYESMHRLILPNGDCRWMLVRGNCIFEARNGTRRPVRIIGSIQDVTAVQDAEARLLRSEDEYRAAFDTAPIGQAECEPDGRVLRANRKLCEVLGRAPETMVGSRFTEMLHPADRDHIWQLYQRLRNGELEHCTVEVRHLRGDGSVIWCRVNASMLRDSRKRPLRMIAIIEDISERRRAERELRERETWLHLALAAGDVGTFDVVPGIDRAARLSPTCRQVMGFGADVAVTREAWLSRVHPDDREAVASSTERAVTRGEPYHHEYRVLRPDNSLVWVETCARIIPDDELGLPRLIGVLRDVTERKEQEQRLIQSAQQKDQFLAMLGHELRNPVAAVRNAVQLARLVPLEDPRLERICGIVDRQTSHMTRLIEDLLDVSRIARGKVPLRVGPVDLRAVVHDAVDDLSEAVAARGLTLRVQTGDEPLWVSGDDTRLSQVLANLLDNARKFTEPPGAITVSAWHDDATGEVVVDVSDTGIGLDPASIGDLFEPFQQGASPQPAATGGLGLGLALVKGLVELHGGRVTTHSSGVGRGASFTVRLPRAQPAPAKVPAFDAQPALRHRRVLVVDDNRDSADVLMETLQVLGHEAAVAYDGAGALEVADRFRPDTVLCDIGLPGDLKGYDVARALRNNPVHQDAYLVAVTGYARPGDREAASRAGFDRHLTKPVTLEELEAVLDR